jgi:hypothetical protein
MEFGLEVDADKLLRGNATQKTEELDRIRDITRRELGNYAFRKAGMVITFGTAPIDDPTQGNRLAAQMNALLLEEFPAVFEDAVLNSYHEITRNPDAGDRVEMEIYWLLE